MPNLLIRNLPADLHAKLKESANAHRRSINQETIATLEQGLQISRQPKPLIPTNPFRPKRPITMKQTISFTQKGQR